MPTAQSGRFHHHPFTKEAPMTSEHLRKILVAGAAVAAPSVAAQKRQAEPPAPKRIDPG
jgi:hypothetical protein